MPEVHYADAGDMPAQTADWTCSACSLAWMNRALGIGIGTDEWSAVEQIGNPANINSTYGLMNATGARLAECVTEQGAPAFTCWPSWTQAFHYADVAGLLLGGVGWNHWVVGRFVRGSDIWIANSAPGWLGVNDVLSESMWEQLGPFAAVVIPVNYGLPDASTLKVA